MAVLLQLPEEILLTEVLTRLPVKSVIRFQSVCKSWKSLFSQASFIKDHLKCTAQNPDEYKLIINKHVETSGTRGRCEIDLLSLSDLSETKQFNVPFPKHVYVPVTLVGSINGLVCLYLYTNFHHEFRLWNPAIRHAQKIEPPFEYSFSFPLDLCGFCWDDAENDFKLVVCDYKYGGLGLLNVYSCNSDSWSLQPRNPSNSDVRTSIPLRDSGVPSAIVNGVPYWQCSKLLDVKTPVIFKFDVRSKEFRMIPKLDAEVIDDRSFLIVNWKECLSALVSKDSNWHTAVDIYCFDEISGIWSKMHSIEPNTGFVHNLVGCFTYGGEIIFGTSGNYMCYDHETNKIKGLGIRKAKLLTCSGYQASLICLQGMKKLRLGSPIYIK